MNDNVMQGIEAVPTQLLQPGDIVTIASMVGQHSGFPEHPYMFGVAVQWCASDGTQLLVHDHMGGTWLLAFGSYVLRLS